METFIIHAAPGTDIWRKPPHTDVFNAPTAVPPGVESTKGSLASFVSASVSLSFVWTERYDQGGLVLSLRKRSNGKSTSPPEKWIKTGIEFYNGKPMLSTVACDTWADWSVAPMAIGDDSSGTEKWTTISICKEQDEHGLSLWVYQVLENGEKRPLREVTWVYGLDSDEWELEVLAMAARPEKKATDSLKVSIRSMEVQWTK